MGHITARDLLAGGYCSAPCLVAIAEDPDCMCRCGGEYHGLLADAPIAVSGTIVGDWTTLVDLPEGLDEVVPVVRSIGQFNAAYRRQLSRDICAQIVERLGGKIRLVTDSTDGTCGILAPEACDLLSVIDLGLCRSGRIWSSGAGVDWYGAHSIKTLREAQILGWVVHRLRHGEMEEAERLAEHFRAVYPDMAAAS